MVEIEVWVLLIISLFAFGGLCTILCYLIGSSVKTNRLKKEQEEQRIRDMGNRIKRLEKRDKENKKSGLITKKNEWQKDYTETNHYEQQ